MHSAVHTRPETAAINADCDILENRTNGCVHNSGNQCGMLAGDGGLVHERGGEWWVRADATFQVILSIVKAFPPHFEHDGRVAVLRHICNASHLGANVGHERPDFRD